MVLQELSGEETIPGPPGLSRARHTFPHHPLVGVPVQEDQAVWFIRHSREIPCRVGIQRRSTGSSSLIPQLWEVANREEEPVLKGDESPPCVSRNSRMNPGCWAVPASALEAEHRHLSPCRYVAIVLKSEAQEWLSSFPRSCVGTQVPDTLRLPSQRVDTPLAANVGDAERRVTCCSHGAWEQGGSIAVSWLPCLAIQHQDIAGPFRRGCQESLLHQFPAGRSLHVTGIKIGKHVVRIRLQAAELEAH